MALFCAAIRRDSVSLLKFPFLSHVQILSCDIVTAGLFKYLTACRIFLTVSQIASPEFGFDLEK